MSKYISEFQDVNGQNYKIEITTSQGDETFKLTLGEEPFVTEMDSSDSHIYQTIKGSRATISFVLSDYIFDFYTESPTGTTITLTNESTGAVEWTGYIQPQMFSQSFELGLNTIEIEAVDCLGVLEDLKYKSDNKERLTFLQILKKIFSQLTPIKDIYVSANSSLTKNKQFILDKLYISEINFFDKKDSDETDDDVCWNCKDVVSEICQFLGLSAVQYGQSLYLLDYDAIKHGINSYYYIPLSGFNWKDNSFMDWPDIQHRHHIIGEDHASNNATVSLDAVYNKVTVKADTYAFEDLFSNLEENITDTDVQGFSSYHNTALLLDYTFAEVFPADDDQSRAMDVWIDVHNDGGGYYTAGKHNYYDFTAMKFLKKANTQHWIYDSNWKDVTSNYNLISHSNFRKNNGCIFVKYFTKNIDKTESSKTSDVSKLWQEYFKNLLDDPNTSSERYLDQCLDYAGIGSISWSEALIMNNMDAKNRPDESDWYKYPYYQITCEGDIVQGGENSAIIIQGNFYWHPVAGDIDQGGKITSVDSYPMEFKDFKLDKENWINPNEDMYIPASVQWGNLWWNGTGWQTTKCGFKLWWMSKENRDDNAMKDKDDTIEAWKCQKTIMQPQPITNTVTWRFGTSEQGHLITMPPDTNLSGKPVLTLYRPITPRLWKSRKDYYNGDKPQDIRWPHYFVALTNFKFKSIMGDPSYSDANKTDTIYTNELENDSILELSEISFKIHTFDNKANTFSAVSLQNGTLYLDKFYNRALMDDEKDWKDHTDTLAENGLRAEEHLIYRLCNQYTKPAKVLECELKKGTVVPYGLYTDTTLSGDFIVTNFGTNYRYAYNTVTLTEKK